MNMVDIWIGLLGLAIILYVVLDGFSLGLGIMLPFMDEKERTEMLNSIAPVWDANQTWLVFGGGGLFVAFPLLYGVLFSALYIPLFTMLYGLIFRGVSFEFRTHSSRKGRWDRAFFMGSLIAVVSQGLTLGGILTGVRTENGHFAGNAFDWLTFFSVAASLGLISGYVLLASTYLIIKTTGPLQDRAFRLASLSLPVVLVFQILMIVWTPFHYPDAMRNWLSSPRVYFIWFFPFLTVFAFSAIRKTLRSRHETAPFLFSLVFFFAGYLGLFSSVYPYALPPDITFYDAAADRATLRFTLTGALAIMPIVLGYTIYSYSIFRGKVTSEDHHY